MRSLSYQGCDAKSSVKANTAHTWIQTYNHIEQPNRHSTILALHNARILSFQVSYASHPRGPWAYRRLLDKSTRVSICSCIFCYFNHPKVLNFAYQVKHLPHLFVGISILSIVEKSVHCDARYSWLPSLPDRLQEGFLEDTVNLMSV